MQSIQVKCRECECRFVTTINNTLVLDAKIIGICEHCYNEEPHDCYDEMQVDENNCFLKVGRKEFL